ncbi:hypothetical protein GF356_00115 [candidate division GN15 bacterium]|nr:hypothetical protein [candidate division GN15 bacterium]
MKSTMHRRLTALLFALFCASAVDAQTAPDTSTQTIGSIPVPEGCIRISQDSGTFGAWLRNLPLEPPSEPIHLHNGKEKPLQRALYRVIDLPIGDRDLQQCADAAIRLRADFLRSVGRAEDIAFTFTSGDTARYSKWVRGYRPVVRDNSVSWEKTHRPDSSDSTYHHYLQTVFTYAGSYSLSRELSKVDSIHNVQPGDCFIEGGFPGHVIMIVDIAIDTTTDDRLLLLAQGFTPAQDIHVIRNPFDDELNPWYVAGKGTGLLTLEWSFLWSDLYRFR